MLPHLPTEVWYMIFAFRRQSMWRERKEKIHHLLHHTVLPETEHARTFSFHDYEIHYFRTHHLEITVTIRRGHFQIKHVLYVLIPQKSPMYCHQTKFLYLPPYNLV